MQENLSDIAKFHDLSSHIDINFDENEQLNESFKVRYLSINDQTRLERDLFVSSFIKYFSIKTFNDDETNFISLAWDDYDILIVGGNDPVRMGKFIKINQMILKSVIKIAVIKNPSPPRRARLLNYGFDEIIDCNKTSKQEADLRINSIASRYKRMKIIVTCRLEQRRTLSDICRPDDLTPREFDILYLLYKNINEDVSIKYMLLTLDPSDPVIFKRSVKVIISRLRRKLNDKYKIMHTANDGYILKNCE